MVGGVDGLSHGQGQALSGITKVGENDIICGRGGLPLKHPGNKVYRNIIGLNKELYATCLKAEKLRISRSVVAAIREIGGRFLEREDGGISRSFDERGEDGSPVAWRDIGDKRATLKTSQALREGQPELLKKLSAQKGRDGATGRAAAAEERLAASNGVFGLDIGLPPQQKAQGNFDQYDGGFQTTGDMSHHAKAPQDGAQREASELSQIFMEEVRRNSKDLLRTNNKGSERIEAETEISPLEDKLDIMTHPSQCKDAGPLAPISNGDDVDIPQTTSTVTTQNDGTRRSSVKFQLPPSNQNDETQEQRTSDLSQIFMEEVRRNSKDLLQNGDEKGGQVRANGHFSASDCQPDFSTSLELCAGEVQRAASDGAVQFKGPKRSSVTFQLPPSLECSMRRSSMSGMSIGSHLSGIFSEALSLDTAMDAAQRDAEFDMLGEVDEGGVLRMSVGTFGDSSPNVVGSAHFPPGGTGPKRGSILKTCGKWTSAGGADPGLMFTSTLDARPGGVNAGTDVSGMLGERRKSAVALEVGVDRRRSSLLSNCSALTNFTERFQREMGSMISIRSADIREMIDDIDYDGDDVEEEDGIGEIAPV